MTELLLALLVLGMYMTAVFAVSLITRNNGIADIAYGGGFVLLALLTFSLGDKGTASLVATMLVAIWALRLSIRIFLRNHGKPEDFRYKKWREEWGSTFIWRSFLQVYMLQGLVIYVVSLPILLIALFGDGQGIGTWGMIGIGIWLVGFYFEAIGDLQLSQFIANPQNKGKIMNQGLWRYTRHPNYFGESVMWWGLAILAASVLGFGLFGPLSFISPLLITYLLLKVSGVPMLEERMQGNPAWQAYAAKTSVFIPLPPKK